MSRCRSRTRVTRDGSRVAPRILAAVLGRWPIVTGLVLGALVGSVTSEAHAQSARSLVEEGNRLYAEGRFQEAHETYLQAMADARDSPVIPFNAGNALYQDADYRRAVEAYQQAIASGDPALASDAWYNLGNALYRQQQLQSSLEAYKQALRLDPDDVDAKHNLERVLQQMQQQPEQQSQQPQDQQEQQQQEGGQLQDQQRQQPQGGQPEDREGDSVPQQEPQTGDEGEEQGGPVQEEEQGPAPEGDARDPTEGQGQPRPAEMTEQEARRLLAAIDEDPEDVNRRPVSPGGRRPSKPW